MDLQSEDSNVFCNVTFDGNIVKILSSPVYTRNYIIPGISYRGNLVAHAVIDYYTNSLAINTLSYLTDTINTNTCNSHQVSIGVEEEGPVFQWQMYNSTQFININDNDDFANATAKALTIKHAPTSYSNTFFRCIINGEPSVVFKLKFENIFTGSIFFETAWENALYWSCGAVPDANTDVYVAKGKVVLNTSTTIKSLALDPGVVLTLKNGASLTLRK